MYAVNVTELRNHLPKYLALAQNGNEVLVTSHGHVIVRIMPPVNTQVQAMQLLKKLRKKCTVGDVVSPIDEEWNATK